MTESYLNELANKHATDKGTSDAHYSRHGYAPIYEDYLSKWRHEPIRMLEVGVCMEHTTGGQSIAMWQEYFTEARIYTFDIVDMSEHILIKDSPKVSFFRGDQSNRKDFEQMYETFGGEEFDFILEDGSHEHEHQIISLGALFKYVKSGGYYILEDMSIPERKVCCIRNDETFKVIENYKNTGKLESEHFTSDEIKYLEEHIDYVHIYEDIQNAYAVAIIKKK